MSSIHPEHASREGRDEDTCEQSEAELHTIM